MVGQDVQSKASDARAERTFKDAEALLDALDLHTAGGLTEVLEAVRAIGEGSSRPPGA